MTAADRKRAADPLATYNRKRDFTRTPEPAGKVAARRAKKPLFMVQKHDATRLHWDLRLEVGGVLKSWAVTRGPSVDPDDKRLAVRTEDHPLSYATFEGTIPEREYGGGTVMLWDRGTWEPAPGKSAADLDADLDKGHLHFILHGERMKGEWLLIRLKPRGKEKSENWLLRKIADDHAGEGDVLVETALTSVASGRTMAEIAAGKPPRKSTGKASAKTVAKAAAKDGRAPRRKAAKPLSLPTPGFREPMLASLSRRVPTGDDWWHEIKFDGYRCLLAIGADGVRCWTRSGLDWHDRYGAIPGAAARLPCASALIDGEVVALGPHGLPSFSALQHQLKQPAPDLLFFAFDLLEQDGESLEKLPLSERKARLERLLEGAGDPLRLSVHTRGDGAALFAALTQEGHEGLVAKRADGAYVHARSSGWLKVKAARREEFVIVGWEPSDKHGRAIRSILLAQREGAGLAYKGKVGTGFDEETMADLCQRFAGLKRAKSPLADRAGVPGKPRWLDPVLVAEVRYAEMTADGAVRHGVFVGLREDKPAAEVRPEREATAETGDPAAPLPRADFPTTNADRAVFGPGGPTKGDLAAWYAAVAPHALRWVADRPLSLVRCPQGITGQCFFQKHLKQGWGEELDSVMVRQKDGSEEPVFVACDADALLRCVQMGTIEFHGWGAPAGAIECPDRLVFDLDPDAGVDFEAVRGAAFDLHDHLAEMGLVTFPMVTGGKGIHVIAPLDGTAGWDAVEDFAQRFARALEQAEPDRFTANLSKARRKGRIFVDYLRNQRGSTAIMPWSVRAREGAPVATPLGWEELRTISSPAQFTLAQPAALLARAAALDPGWGVARQALPDA